MTDERMEQAGMFELPSIVGQEAFLRFIAVVEVLDQFHTSDVDAMHWYLLVVGVDPVQQDQGIGAALMQPVLARADAASLPSYLETTNERNVGFYMHLGFQVVHDVVEPVSGLRLWTFKRDPQRADRAPLPLPQVDLLATARASRTMWTWWRRHSGGHATS